MPPCVGPVVAWGILANAAATGLAAAAYAAAAVAAQLRQRRIGHGTSAAPLLFATIAVYLAVASLRQVAAWRSGSDAEWVDVDRTLYLVVILPAAFVIVPHVHLVSMVLWGRPRRSQALALAFLAVVAVGLAFAYIGGITGPVTSAYGSDWSLNSPVTKVLLLVAIMLPGLVGSGALVVLAKRLDPAGRRRVRLIGWSTLVYFGVFTADAFGLAGIPLLLARLATAATGVVAWAAYQQAAGPVVYEPPPEDPKDAVYERKPGR